MLGKKHSEETKAKIRKNRKGKNLGAVATPESIEKRTETRRKNGWLKEPFTHRGEKHWNWKGGIARKYLRTLCKERDNGTCQDCGLHEPEIMDVDHIKAKAKFPELQHELSNLITLCPNCHRRKTLREKDLLAV